MFAVQNFITCANFLVKQRVSVKNAMAWRDDREGIPAIGGAHGPCRRRASNLARNLCVAARLAVRDPAKLLPDIMLKGCAVEHHHHRPSIRARVEGVESADHPTDGELLDHARRFVEAADRFDPKQNVTFVTFAYYRIRGAMLDELRDSEKFLIELANLESRARAAARTSARIAASSSGVRSRGGPSNWTRGWSPAPPHFS